MNRIIFAAGISLLFFACSKSSNNNNAATPQKSLMPLAVGNYWQYNKVNYDSITGKPVDSVSDGIYIVGEVSVNGTPYFQQNQVSITNINAPSYFIIIDSNTLGKIDSATQYIFFKRVNSLNTDSTLVDSWKDTVSSRCKGLNLLYGFADSVSVDGYTCLHNEVDVTDCIGTTFEKWEYYLKPGLGLVRIQLYRLNSIGAFYLQFSEDLTNYHTS